MEKYWPSVGNITKFVSCSQNNLFNTGPPVAQRSLFSREPHEFRFWFNNGLVEDVAGCLSMLNCSEGKYCRRQCSFSAVQEKLLRNDLHTFFHCQHGARQELDISHYLQFATAGERKPKGSAKFTNITFPSSHTRIFP